MTLLVFYLIVNRSVTPSLSTLHLNSNLFLSCTMLFHVLLVIKTNYISAFTHYCNVIDDKFLSEKNEKYKVKSFNLAIIQNCKGWDVYILGYNFAII